MAPVKFSHGWVLLADKYFDMLYNFITKVIKKLTGLKLLIFFGQLFVTRHKQKGIFVIKIYNHVHSF